MTNEPTCVSKSATKSTQSATHSSPISLIRSLRSIQSRSITTIYYERVHSKLNGSLFLWCGRRLRRADDIRFVRQNCVYRECERTRQTRLELEELLHFSFFQSRLVSTFFKLLLLIALTGILVGITTLLSQSREIILLFQFVKRRDTRYYIEDARIASDYRSTRRKKRVF